MPTLYDHRTGLVSNQSDFQFDRGDQVKVRFKEGWKSGDRVRTGEKVATISSNRLGEELIKLRNQLAVEEANLGVVASGQKPQVIGQSEEEVNLAKADLALRKQNLERTRQLHVDGLIPLTQLEQAENTYNESLARLRIAEKSLQAQSTGEKPEAVSLALSRITSLRREIAFLEGKSNRYVVNAPFDVGDGHSLVFFEIKKKVDEPLHKSRAALGYAEAREALLGKPLEEVAVTVTRSADAIEDAQRFIYHVRARRMQPVITVIYEREPYQAIFVDEENDLRITFDF